MQLVRRQLIPLVALLVFAGIGPAQAQGPPAEPTAIFVSWSPDYPEFRRQVSPFQLFDLYVMARSWSETQFYSIPTGAVSIRGARFGIDLPPGALLVETELLDGSAAALTGSHVEVDVLVPDCFDARTMPLARVRILFIEPPGSDVQFCLTPPAANPGGKPEVYSCELDAWECGSDMSYEGRLPRGCGVINDPTGSFCKSPECPMTWYNCENVVSTVSESWGAVKARY